MRTVLIAVSACLASGGLLGVSVGTAVDAHWSPLWGVPGAFILLFGVALVAWNFYIP